MYYKNKGKKVWTLVLTPHLLVTTLSFVNYPLQLFFANFKTYTMLHLFLIQTDLLYYSLYQQIIK